MKLHWQESETALTPVWHLVTEEDHIIAFVEAGYPDEMRLGEIVDAPPQYRGKFLGRETKWQKNLRRAKTDTLSLIYYRCRAIETALQRHID